MRRPSRLVLAASAAVLAAAAPAGAQEVEGPIATHRAASSAAAAPTPAPPTTDAPDPFAWLRRPTGEEAVRWRAQEEAQARRWLAVDPNYAPLLKAASASPAGALVEAAAGRLFVRGPDGAGLAWRSRPAQAAEGWRREPALGGDASSPAADAPADAPRLACDDGAAGRLCLLIRHSGDGLALARFDPATGAVGPDPFPAGGSLHDVAVEDDAHVLAVTQVGDAPAVVRLTLGQPHATPVVFRGATGERVTPGSATAPGGVRVSWLTVRHADGGATLLVESRGEFRQLAAPDGSEIVGVVGDQLVVVLRRGWREGGFPAGALLAFDLKPLLARAPELTPHAILKLSDAPDIRQVAATRSGLLLIAREGGSEVAYLCEPSLRGWAVRRLSPTAADDLTIAAWSAADDMAVLRSRAFPQGDQLTQVDLRTGALTPVEPAREDFAGHPRRTFDAPTLDGTHVAYTVIEGAAPGAAPRPVLLLDLPRDARETAFARDLGGLWLAHGGDLAVVGRRARRYLGGEGVAQVLVRYEDLSNIARDLVARGLARPGGVALAGSRLGASVAAVDVAKHPSQWSAAVLSDPVVDPIGAESEPVEAWAQAFAGAGAASTRKAWRRIAPYDNLHAGARYAPVLTLDTPEASAAFGSDAQRFTARLNAAGGDSLNVEARDLAQACALAAAFLFRVLGLPPSVG